MRKRLLVLVLCVVPVLVPDTVSAQANRDGAFIRAGLGIGSLGGEGSSNRNQAPSGYVTLGETINDRVSVGAEALGWVKSGSASASDYEAGATVTVGSLSAVAYIYDSPNSGFFFKGGIGLAWIDFDLEAPGIGFSLSERVRGTALTAGFGFDGGRVGSVRLTPHANFVYSVFEAGSLNLVQFGIGLIWSPT